MLGPLNHARRAASKPDFKLGHYQAANIREALSELGPDATAAQVVARLAAQRVRVTPQQVYNARSMAAKPQANGYAELIQAKRLAEAMGGIERARAALDVLAKLVR